MSDEQLHFLRLWPRPVACLTAQQTAWALGFQLHDIRILVAARLLKPVGDPPRNGVKYFAAVEIMELAKDRAWLARANNARHEHWHDKNQRKTWRNGHEADEGVVA